MHAIILFIAALCFSFINPTTQPVVYELHNGYFVSNKYEPDASVSFAVVTSQKQFDEIFGIARVMHDKGNHLPEKAFDSLVVLTAIKRGKGFVTFDVKDVKDNDSVITVNYTTQTEAQGTAEFACPLILSIAKGQYKSIIFIENDKQVKKIDLATPATQPSK